MSQKAMGVINLIHEFDELEVLTQNRCPATVPFGARYRLVDFMMSSMVNSGISDVAVFAHTKYRSLMDHLGAGRPWDLHTRQSGLFILPPSTIDVAELGRGDLYHFYQHRDYFYRSTLDYVVIARSHMVCNIDLNLVVEQHEQTEADITVVYKRQSDLLGGKARKITLDADGRVTQMQESFGSLDSDLHCMEIYVMKKDFLLNLVEASLAQGKDHLVRDAIQSHINTLYIRGYEYKGYLGVINTVQSYYHNSMQLLRPEVWQNLFFAPAPIYTKTKDEPPTRYLDGAKTGNSLIANGCKVEGTVINSIVFRGVHVGKGAVIRNSVIMQNCEIEAGSHLNYTIFDKDVKVGEGKEVIGTASQPFVAGKRKVI